MSMPALRLHGVGDLRYEQIAEPGAPEAGMVRLKILAAGICGSDLHNYRTGQWIDHLPVTPGHEYCAEVEAVGDDVTDIAPGDRVVGDSRVVCGACDYCENGETNLCRNLGFVGEACDGAFSAVCLQPAERLYQVSADLPPAVAALAEPLAVALHVIERLEAPAGEPILIVGGGTIGALVALVADARGLGPVYVAERQARRRALLASVCNATPVALERDALIMQIGREPRFAVEATGSHGGLAALMASVGAGTRLAMVGLFHGAGEVDVNAIVEQEIDLIGCSAFREELPRACDLLPELAPRLARLIDAPIGLESAAARYDELIEQGREAIKSIVVPAETSHE